MGKTRSKARSKRVRTGALGALLAATTATAVLGMAAPASASGDTTVIAHRGDMQSAPESTNAAFRKAIRKGADAIEMDVRFSSTGYPMIMHDATLERTTTCSGPINRYTRIQLAKCDAGVKFAAVYRGERIPKLDVALRTIAQASSTTKVLLHVKVLPTTVQAKRIRNSVDMRGMMGRTIIIADTNSILAKMATVGFKERGRVFGAPDGWNLTAEYMIPYGVPLDRSAIRAIHNRGGKVWPVESPGLSLTSILGLDSIDGVLTNRLGAVLHLL